MSQVEDQPQTGTEPDPQTGKPGIKIDLVLIAIIGLLLQAFWVSQLTQPTYMDAYYYTTNGQRLAEGHGFTESVIWQFLDDPQGLPTPSHTYWMPLPSILAAAGYLVRDDFTGAQMLFWLLGGLLPLLAYGVSRQLSGERWQGWVAAMLAAAGGYYAPFLGQPSTFAPFAWAGGLSLLAVGLARMPAGVANQPLGLLKRGNSWYWFVAGVTAGLAHLTRADGFLLLVVASLFWVAYAWRGREQRQVSGSRPLLQLALLLGGYLLVMAPWFIRNIQVTGGLLSTAGTQSIFLTTYNDLFAYGRTMGADAFFAWGWINIIQSRLQGAALALQTLVAIPGLIFLGPFILIGLVNLYRRRPAKTLLQPLLLYILILLLSTVLLFTFPGMRGSLFHSSVALWPWTTALAAAGIGFSVDWIAARLSHWQPERAKRLFSTLFIVVAFLLTFFVSQFRLSPDQDPAVYYQIEEQVAAGSVVMIGNAPALYYYTGLAAVSVPNEAAPVLLQAADRYGVTHLVLDKDRPLPLDTLYRGEITEDRLRLLLTFDDVQLYEIQPTR